MSEVVSSVKVLNGVIDLGETADGVLGIIRRRPDYVEVLEKVDDELVVCWHYMRFDLILRRSKVEGVEAYRVSEIRMRERRRKVSP